MPNQINIVFAIDKGYLQHLAAAMQSLLVNNKNLYFKIYIINGDIEPNDFNKLLLITNKFNCELISIKIDDDLFESFVSHCHFTKATYYRLLIPELINDDRVLYLDADIIVNASLDELYKKDLEGNFIGAVSNPDFNRHAELNMHKDSNYFNSGIMLIDNKKWKEYGLGEKVIDFVGNNPEVCNLLDQDGLNAVINGKWKRLDLKFNQQAVIFDKNFLNQENLFGSLELREAKSDPVIIHYTGSSKPWHFRNKHPYKNLYMKYFKMTPFKPFIYVPEDLTIKNILKFLIPKSLKGMIKKYIYNS